MKQIYFIYVSHQGEKNVETYQTEEDIKNSVAGKPAPYHTREKITPDGQRVVFYKEKHALAYGPKMKEYLGLIEIDPGNSEDQKVFNMTADEIRMMDLPKVQPRPGINKVIMKGRDTILWDEYFARR